MDKHFLAALKRGDEDAHTKAFNLHSINVYNWAFNILKDNDEANDIVQEVFAAFWRDRESINITTTVKGYLTGMAKFKALDVLRAKKKQGNQPLESGETLPAEQSPNNDMESKDSLEFVRAAVNKIPSEKHKDAFILVHIDGRNYKEAAQKMGISVPVIRVYVSRAIQFLRPILQNSLLILLWFQLN
ncbi:RNA polymerase sigma factor, sigma-70 family [Chitinophaga sp. YR573]|uniref:RNA polymerase sigma factor n=1 Tax=Chitinophaga sp. YR573 TaxID=1881040 RepID=UPI0008D4A7C5|nr:RNA polymerase sigma factor [Chitinophaga sp. YR573]SEW44168.1 RNA polymerase sigma factor, sigma-70 family [Chitinophaga sp. YR573]